LVKKEAMQAEINIGMIGHVDHGKTSLVKALTTKWTDTHSEELKKGISIRLGYADATFYNCDKAKGSEGYNATGKCEGIGEAKVLRKVSFVDAPGHETLMATMLSGAALMDGAVLVIAANESCPQPSTAEHLMALSIAGVKNVVVAQNKIDLVDLKRAKESYSEIEKFLKEYGYEGAPIIPIAANFGTNIDLLIEAIEKHIPTKKKDDSKPLKAFIVRSFDINKPGTKIENLKGGVLGGSIIQGKMKIGDVIEVGPMDNGKTFETKITSIGIEGGGMLKEAKAGGLIAFGTKIDPFFTKNDEMRGQVVGKKGTLPAPTKNIKVKVKLLKRLIDNMKTDLKANEFVVLAIGTSTTVGQIIKNAGQDEFEIATNSFVIVEKGENVAISKRDPSGWRLSAYGTIQ